MALSGNREGKTAPGWGKASSQGARGSAPEAPFRPSRAHFRLMGALVRGVDLRYLGEKNTPVLHIPLGASGPKGTWYLTVDLWGPQAESRADDLRPGQVVYAEGEMRWYRPPEGGRGRVNLTARLLRVLSGTYPMLTDRKGQARLQGGINEVWLQGSLASEVRSLASKDGGRGATFSVGVPGIGFFDVVLWGEEAERLLASVPERKQPLLVRGALQSRSYTDKEGRTVWAVGIRGEEVHLLARGAQADRQGQEEGLPTEYDLPGEEELPF